MFNRWCGSYVEAIEKKKIGKRQGPLLCRKWQSKVQCVFLRFSTCCFHVYSRGLTTTTQWGDTILSLSESCLLSNPVGKTTKTSSSKQVILQMHSICFSFKDMTSVKIWRDEVKAAENLLFTQAVAKNGFVFWKCTGSQRRNLIPTLGII